MDVTPLIRQGQKIIQSYSGGTFRIGGELFSGPVIVTPDHVMPWAVSGTFASLKDTDFAPLAGVDRPDVVLIGTGQSMQMLMPGLRKALKAMDLSADSMDTGAACRTYNVLMAEGRRVAAALLPYA